MKPTLALLIALLLVPLAAHAIAPALLKTEFLENPLGIDTVKPRFSWIVEDATPGAKQTAYQVQAASSPEMLSKGNADLWDSGKIASGQSHLVRYAGKPLISRQQVWWRVKSWDKDGTETDWSEPARFEVGLLNAADWSARWIRAGLLPVTNEASDFWVRCTTVPVNESNLETAGPAKPAKMPAAAEMNSAETANMAKLEKLTPAPLMRREVALNGIIKKARVYITAPGFFELRVNGQKVGDRELEPGVFPYHETTLYSVHDITPYVRQGGNALGVILGQGIFNNSGIGHFCPNMGKEPLLCAQFEFELGDGSRVVVHTDEIWKSAPGPILKDSHFLGECYDARLEPDGWDTSGYDDRAWKAALIADSPAMRLAADLVQPERVVRRIKAVRLYSPAKGVWVYDMGEAFSGAAELKVEVPAGTMLSLRYAQRVFLPDQPYGSILRYENTQIGSERKEMIAPSYSSTGIHPSRVGGLPYQPYTPTDVYVGRGGGEEIWRRRFSYTGYRYVELTGYPGKPPLDAVTGVVVHTDLPRAGDFSCSNEILNRLHAACVNTYLYCTHGFTQDNPTREKQYCPEMTSGPARMAAAFLPMHQLWRKIIESSLITQDETGNYHLFCGLRARTEHPLHEDGPVRLTYLLWERYNDEQVLKDSLDAHAAYFDYYWDNPSNRRPKDMSLRYLAAEDLSKGYLRGGFYCFDWYSDNTTFDISYKHPPRDQERLFWGTGVLMENLNMFLTMAHHAERNDLENNYRVIYDRVSAELNAKFYNADAGSYGTMSRNALALSAGIVPEKEQARVVAAIVSEIKKLNVRLVAGTHGIWRLIDVLSANGHENLVFQLLTRETYPGLASMLKTGHGTFFENPNTLSTPYGAASSLIQSEKTRFGFYFAEYLGGIRPDPDHPGFQRFELGPVFPDALDTARAEVPSPYGKILSEWKRTGDSIHWNVTVPWNTTATVKLPNDAQAITINGQPKERSEFNLPAGKWEIHVHHALNKQ